MEKIKEIKSEIRETIGVNTGELIEVSEKSLKVLSNKDDFMLVYTSFWNTLIKADLNKSDIELLAYLIKNYGDGALFSITKLTLNDLKKTTNKPNPSYINSTRKLINSGFIIKEGFRNYRINPQVAFKGNSNRRNKLVIEMLDI